QTKDFGAIGVFISNENLKEIANKIKLYDEESLAAIHHNRSSYRLSEVLYEEKAFLLERNKASERFMIGSNIFDKIPEIFSDTKSHFDSNEQIAKIYGRESNRRVYKFIKGKYISDHPNFVKWKVFLAKSNGTGEMGERLSPPEIASPFTVATQTFISFG